MTKQDDDKPQSGLSKRYSGAFEERIAQAIADKVQKASPASNTAQGIDWKRLKTVLVPGVAGVTLLWWTFGGETQGASRLPVQKAPMMSSQAAGLAPSAEQIIPRGKPRPAAPPLEAMSTPEPTPTPRPTYAKPRRVEPMPVADTKVQAAATPCSECDRNEQLRAMGVEPPTEVIYDASAGGDGFSAHVRADDEPEPAILNVGTRFKVEISEPVRTSGGGIPVTATAMSDVLARGRTVIPKGTHLVGEAFATTTDDRVQLVFSALIYKGVTTRLSGITFDKDGQLGLRGKVIKKGRGKRALGGVLRAGASVLSMGVLGTDDAPSRAVDSMMRDASRGLSSIESQWDRDLEKVIQVPAGVQVTVFLRDDLRLEL